MVFHVFWLVSMVFQGGYTFRQKNKQIKDILTFKCFSAIWVGSKVAFVFVILP